MIPKKNESMHEKVPQYLDNTFCLTEKLDEGAFGMIYRAYNVEDPQDL